MIGGFFVKLPVFLFHPWLPQAHVEAPLAGSMLLAGVLLKLGAFGIIRFLWVISRSLVLVVGEFFLVIGLWGGVLSSCFCICQRDVKATIAYSSIGHMSFCLVGILRNYPVGWRGAGCLIFAHGLCSSLLFSIVAIIYDASKRQSLPLNNGTLLVLPSFSLVWCLGCVVNIGFPPTLNFLGEVLLISRGVGMCYLFASPIGIMCFLSGVYCLYLFGTVCHGGFSNMLFPFSSSRGRYLVRSLYLLYPLFFGFLGIDFFMV